MAAILQADEGRTRTLEEQFIDLVCSDEALLRAEFEDIITAEWPAPPSTRPPSGRRTHRAEPPRSDAAWTESGGPRLAHRPRHPGIGGWAHQRSPPSAPTA